MTVKTMAIMETIDLMDTDSNVQKVLVRLGQTLRLKCDEIGKSGQGRRMKNYHYG